MVRREGQPVASSLVRLERALVEVEGILDSVEAPRPDQIVFEWFSDDPLEAVLEYKVQLMVRFPRSVVITIEALCSRPAGLKAPWTPPRAWLDYEPESR